MEPVRIPLDRPPDAELSGDLDPVAVMSLPAGDPVRCAALATIALAQTELFNRGELEATLALFASDVELRPDPDGPRALGIDLDPVYHGHEGMRRFYEQWFGPWQEVKFHPLELVDPGNDRLAMLARMTYRGRSSGIEVDQEWGGVNRVRGGLIVRQDQFFSHDAALRALLGE